ncbi:MAG: alpha/beta fold hydrolase [Acidimicrobiales bacterium]|nr:alpha/beta fold hydrolase [Acidimicrobiales bacterium]
MPTLQVEPDISLVYELTGPANAEPLLFISGTGGDLRAPNLLRSRFAKSFRVIAYDQRGLGRSSKPDRPFTMADYAADAARLLDHLDLASAKVFGISFGGMVAQEFAVTWPQRVERLLLACTSTGGIGGASYPLHTLAPSGDPRADSARRLELADTRRTAQWRAEHRDEVDKMVDLALETAAIGAGEPGREVGARRQLEARAGHDTYDRLGVVGCPCLIQGGLYDGIASPDNLETLAGRIQGSTLKMYQGGHLFHLQDRAALDDAVAFLAS